MRVTPLRHTRNPQKRLLEAPLLTPYRRRTPTANTVSRSPRAPHSALRTGTLPSTRPGSATTMPDACKFTIFIYDVLPFPPSPGVRLYPKPPKQRAPRPARSERRSEKDEKGGILFHVPPYPYDLPNLPTLVLRTRASRTAS